VISSVNVCVCLHVGLWVSSCWCCWDKRKTGQGYESRKHSFFSV